MECRGMDQPVGGPRWNTEVKAKLPMHEIETMILGRDNQSVRSTKRERVIFNPRYKTYSQPCVYAVLLYLVACHSIPYQ
jgi:hypothetical protein